MKLGVDGTADNGLRSHRGSHPRHRLIPSLLQHGTALGVFDGVEFRLHRFVRLRELAETQGVRGDSAHQLVDVRHLDRLVLLEQPCLLHRTAEGIRQRVLNDRVELRQRSFRVTRTSDHLEEVANELLAFLLHLLAESGLRALSVDDVADADALRHEGLERGSDGLTTFAGTSLTHELPDSGDLVV